MTNEINPNRGGPIHSAPDTLRPRLSVRGRTGNDSSGTYRDRLQAQIEKPGVEVSYCPEINTKAVIKPSQELDRKWGEVLKVIRPVLDDLECKE